MLVLFSPNSAVTLGLSKDGWKGDLVSGASGLVLRLRRPGEVSLVFVQDREAQLALQSTRKSVETRLAFCKADGVTTRRRTTRRTSAG